jgi:cystathionine gamma-synthase
MLSFELARRRAAVEAFLAGLECFTLAESLGGVESLISHPASMTHAGMEESARLRAGIGAGLLRVSVGIEDPADLVADLAMRGPPTPRRRLELKRSQHRICRRHAS